MLHSANPHRLVNYILAMIIIIIRNRMCRTNRRMKIIIQYFAQEFLSKKLTFLPNSYGHDLLYIHLFVKLFTSWLTSHLPFNLWFTLRFLYK